MFQRCVSLEEGQQILREIHEGYCGHHASTRSLMANAFRHGFFWLTTLADVERIVNRCDGCQRYARQIHVPAQELRTIPLTWLFAVWGMDMVGPIQMSPCNKLTSWLLLISLQSGLRSCQSQIVNSQQQYSS